jgi:hypothetical protein
MKAAKRTTCVGLAIALGGLLASSTAWAVPTPVFSTTGDRTVLNVTNDTVVWEGAEFASVLSGATFTSPTGFEVKVFRQGTPVLSSLSCDDGNPLGCDFEIKVQPSSWTGNFTNDDHVLDNLLFTPFDDSIQIEFSEPVLGAGTQLQLVAQAPFTGRARAYATPFIDGPGGDPADDAFLAEFTLEGISCNSNAVSPPTPCPQGSAIFMGFSDGAIRRMEFNVLDESGAEARFGINQLDIGVRVVVPEPSTFLLLTTGVLALAYRSRRFPRR